MFKCRICETIMIIETNLDDNQIHQVPPCPCGKSRMLNMSSDEYAYGPFRQYKLIKEINLGIEEVENQDVCLCLDCQVNISGLNY